MINMIMIEEIHHLKNQEEEKEFIQMNKFLVHLFQCPKSKTTNNTRDRNLIGKINFIYIYLFNFVIFLFNLYSNFIYFYNYLSYGIFIHFFILIFFTYGYYYVLT